MELMGYLAAIFMGITLGVTGGGGSILTLPILVYLFQISPVSATGYSLFIVGATSLVGAVSSSSKGLVNLRAGFVFALPSFVGVYLSRAFLLPAMPEVLLQWGEVEISKSLLVMLVFAILMLLASVSMIRGRKNEKKRAESVANTIKLGVQGFFIGLVTGFVGAGGGFLIVPALVVLVGLPMSQAVGTSLAIIAANSLFGFLTDVLREGQDFKWSLLLTLSGLSMIGILVGLRVAQHLPDRLLKKIFGWFVFIMGSVIIVEQVFRMS